MTTLRRRFKQGFTTIANKSAEDNRLTLRARGLLVYLLAKPDGWQVRSTQIAGEVPDGRDAVQASLRELAHFRYYRIRDERQPGGAFRRYTDVSDSPVDEPGWGHTLPTDPEELAELVCETCRVDAGLPRNKKRAIWPRSHRQAPERDRPARDEPERDTSGSGGPDSGRSRSITKNLTQDEVPNERINFRTSTRAPRDARARATVFAELVEALKDNFGSSVRTDDLDAERRDLAACLATEHGIPALIQYAIEVDDRFASPARSISAFIEPWCRIPPWCGDCDVTRWLLDRDGTLLTPCPKCHPDARQPSTEAVSA